MANKTVIIAEIKENDKFINIISNDGINYGIGKENNPVLAKQLTEKKVGDEITGSYWSKEKDGKTNHYLFDPKEGGGKSGGKSYTPRDKNLDAAIGAAQAAAYLLSLDKDKKPSDIQGAFELFYKLITDKITK